MRRPYAAVPQVRAAAAGSGYATAVAFAAARSTKSSVLKR